MLYTWFFCRALAQAQLFTILFDAEIWHTGKLEGKFASSGQPAHLIVYKSIRMDSLLLLNSFLYIFCCLLVTLEDPLAALSCRSSRGLRFQLATLIYHHFRVFLMLFNFCCSFLMWKCLSLSLSLSRLHFPSSWKKVLSFSPNPLTLQSLLLVFRGDAFLWLDFMIFVIISPWE